MNFSRMQVELVICLMLVSLVANSAYAYPPNIEALMTEARVFADKDQWSQAETVVRKALTLAEQKYGKDSPDLCRVLISFGNVFYYQDNYKGAEDQFKRAFLLAQRLPQNANGELVVSRFCLGLVYDAQHRYKDAQPLFLKCLSEMEANKKKDLSLQMKILQKAAHTCFMLQDFAQAQNLFSKLLSVQTDVLGSNNLQVADTLSNLGIMYQMSGKYKLAEDCARKVIGIIEAKIGSTSRELVEPLYDLGICSLRQNDLANAENAFKRQLAIQDTLPEKDRSHYAEVVEQLFAVYLKQKDFQKAEALLDQKQDNFGQGNGIIFCRMGLAANQHKWSEVESFGRKLSMPAPKSQEHIVLPVYKALLATALCYQEKFDEASSVLDQNLDVTNTNALLNAAGLPELLSRHKQQVLLLRGIIALNKKKFTDAEAILKQEIELAHTTPPQLNIKALALNYLAVSYANQSKYAEAELTLNEAMSMQNNTHPDLTLYLLSNVYAEEGKWYEAKKNMSQLLSLLEKTDANDPRLAYLVAVQGLYCFKLKEYLEAESLFRKALSSWPETKTVRNSESVVLTVLASDLLQKDLIKSVLVATYNAENKYDEAAALAGGASDKDGSVKVNDVDLVPILKSLVGSVYTKPNEQLLPLAK